MIYKQLSQNWIMLQNVGHVLKNPPLLYQIATALSPTLSMFVFLHLCWTSRKGLDFLYHSCFKGAGYHTGYSFSNIAKMFALLSVSMLVTFGGELNYPLFSVLKRREFYDEPVVLLRYVTADITALRDMMQTVICPSLVFLLFFYDSIFRFTTMLHLSFLTCYVIKRIGDEVQDYLEDEKNSLPCEKFIEMYDIIVQLIGDINESLGVLVLATIVNTLSFFSQALTTVLDSEKQLWDRLYVIGIVSFFGIFVGFAAQGADRLENIEGFVSRKKQDPDYNENRALQLMIPNMTNNPLGLKAFKFRISYGFIVSIFSTAVTYFIILLQFSTSSDKQ
ncbi:uncharacterized protein LOC118434003 [Folsomia candida]|uniref:uncharacterized protein LOC118433649 n=1 Tax=Folsomia candida TaxID=158441 RepID=UPI001604F336|nr:uncharacterized protein LOC118433649 [Folsomia candida]XP_035702499.1 uncharacterized protein LOC118434003 [Folsomia candida]